MRLARVRADLSEVSSSCGVAEAGQYAYKGCFRHETQNVIARWTNDATTWAARTWMSFDTQKLSVARHGACAGGS